MACDMACCDEAWGMTGHSEMPACGEASPGVAQQSVHSPESILASDCSVKCARVPAGFAKDQFRGLSRLPGMVAIGAVAAAPGFLRTILFRDVFSDSSISPRAPPFSLLEHSPTWL